MDWDQYYEVVKYMKSSDTSGSRKYAFGFNIELPNNNSAISFLKDIECSYSKLNDNIEVVDNELVKGMMKYNDLRCLGLLSGINHGYLMSSLLYGILSDGTCECLRCFLQHYPDTYFVSKSMVTVCMRSDENIEMLEIILNHWKEQKIDPENLLFIAIYFDKSNIMKYLFNRYCLTLFDGIKKLIVRNFSKDCLTELVKSRLINFDDDMCLDIANIEIGSDKSKDFIKTILEFGQSGLIPKFDTIICSLRNINGNVINELLNEIE
jgi:hypothetical protein